MELINALTVPDRDIRQLYKQAFPANERAPYTLLKRRAAQGKANMWRIADAGKWVGMAYVLRRGSLAYVFYLAIDEKSRGRGYGTAAVETLHRKYADCRLFLALETLDPHAANYEERVKRRLFYQRCGLMDMPYQLKEATVIYDIMGIGGPVEPEEYKEMIDAWVGWPRKKMIDMRMIASASKQ